MYYIIYLYHISILDIYRYTFSVAKFFDIDSFVMLPYYLLIGNVSSHIIYLLEMSLGNMSVRVVVLFLYLLLD